MNKTKSEDLELIQNDPKKAIRKFAIPVTISFVFMTLNSVINTIWVSGLGAGPLAAVGFVTPLFMALLGLGAGLGAGTNAVIARYMGSGSKKQANNAAAHAFLLIIILTVIITTLCYVFLDNILLAMGAADVMSYARAYGGIIVIGIYSFLLPNILGGILRSEGNIKKATYPLIIGALVNLIINPYLIYDFGLGVFGAGLGTVLSQTIFGLIPMLYWIFIERSTEIKISFAKFKLDLSIYKDILVVGIPASLEEIIMAVLSAFINGVLVLIAGSASVAVFSAVWRLVSIGVGPAIGVGMASVTVIGTAYGAKNWENLKKAFNASAEYSLWASVAVFLLFYVFAGEISALFSFGPTAALAPAIAEALRNISLYVIVVAIGLVATYFFQSIGKGMISLGISIVRELILIISAILVFTFVLGWGEIGVYTGIVVGAAIGSAFSYFYSKYYMNKLVKTSA